MAVIEMPVRADLPAFTFKQELDGIVFTFDFRFNERFECWIMDILSEQGVALLQGIPVQTEVDIASRFLGDTLPQGQFIVIDETGEQRNPDRDNFGGEVKLLYLDVEELTA